MPLARAGPASVSTPSSVETDMGETRTRLRQRAEQSPLENVKTGRRQMVSVKPQELLDLLNDADRLAAIERVDEMRRTLSEPAVPEAIFTHRLAIRSSCQMLRARFEEAKCDSDGVDCCIRCNVMFLVNELDLALAKHRERGSFQSRVHPWMMACFGEAIANDQQERNHRFLEEALELVQSCGCTKSEAIQLVAYVYGRDIGDREQEAGGAMVTLAALCSAHGIDMHECADRELARCWEKIDQIRAKQAAKPDHSPLPQHEDEQRVPDVETIRDVICLLEQSAGPFDEACRLLRAAVPEPDQEKDG